MINDDDIFDAPPIFFQFVIMGSNDPMGSQVDPERKARNGLRFRLLQETTQAWPSLRLYQCFEQLVALVLSILISCVIVVATAHLILVEVRDFFLNPLASVDAAIQSIFGMIITVLIALVFSRAVTNVLHRKNSIVRLRAVILITLLAMVRKFIIVDFASLEPLAVFGLACVVLALGLVHCLVGEQDRSDAPHETNSVGAR